MSWPRHAARQAALEMRQLLRELTSLTGEGDRIRYQADHRYRWVMLAGDTATWRQLRLLRNELAHTRLPDIDEDKVWRLTVVRPSSLLALLDRLVV